MTMKLSTYIPEIYELNRNGSLQKSVNKDPTYGGKNVKKTN